MFDGTICPGRHGVDALCSEARVLRGKSRSAEYTVGQQDHRALLYATMNQCTSLCSGPGINRRYGFGRLVQSCALLGTRQDSSEDMLQCMDSGPTALCRARATSNPLSYAVRVQLFVAETRNAGPRGRDKVV
jgi:hypothetical protein